MRRTRKVRVEALVGKGKTQFAFKRDANGKLDPNGKFAAKKSDLHFKFEEEAQISLGVAKVKTVQSLAGVLNLSIPLGKTW